MGGLLPWAIAGLVGWLAPRFIVLREDWQRALVAAIGGAVVGLLL